MAQHPRTTDASEQTTTDRKTSLTRRNYVQSLAAVATAATTLGATGTVAADEEYEVIDAENQTITISDGETWENKLIDMTTGGDIIVIAEGTDWTIRNVGFHGENTSGAGSATFGVADTGGATSTIENVYLGDGSDGRNGSPTGHGQTAFWVSPDHSGHLDFERLNIRGFADNAIYASAPGNAGGGTVHIDRCFAANCYVSHYRLATEGSRVTNSSILVDEDGFDGRGVWAWAPGTVEVEGCQIEMNGANTAIDAGANGNGTTVLVRDTDYDERGGIAEHDGSTVRLDDNVGTDPEPFIPDGVPTAADEAASGR